VAGIPAYQSSRESAKSAIDKKETQLISAQLGDIDFHSFLANLFSIGALVLSAIVLYKVW